MRAELQREALTAQIIAEAKREALTAQIIAEAKQEAADLLRSITQDPTEGRRR